MEHILNLIKENFKGQVGIYPRREGLFQLILPVFYEDGDMVDVYVQQCPDKKDKIRISDCGMTFMRLSYTYDINSPTREKIFTTILNQNSVINEDGNLYIDTSPEFIYQNLMQFVVCQQKICNMRLWQKETVRSLFFEKLEAFVESDLRMFKPEKSVIPLKDYPIIEVDYSFEFSRKPFYLFGVTRTLLLLCLSFKKRNFHLSVWLFMRIWKTCLKKNRYI